MDLPHHSKNPGQAQKNEEFAHSETRQPAPSTSAVDNLTQQFAKLPGAVDSASNEEDILEVLSQHSGQQSSFFSSTSEDDDDTAYPHPETWSESILNVLNDPDGTELFDRFLREHKLQNYRLFYLGVWGWKDANNADRPKRDRVPHQIYKMFICEPNMLLGALTDATRENIISTFQPFHITDIAPADVFDVAQEEVYQHMQNNLLPLFIQTDLYLDYLNSYGNPEYADDEEESPEIQGEDSEPAQTESVTSVEYMAPADIDRPPPIPAPFSQQAPPWQRHPQIPPIQPARHHSSLARDDSGVFAVTPQTPQYPAPVPFPGMSRGPAATSTPYPVRSEPNSARQPPAVRPDHFPLPSTSARGPPPIQAELTQKNLQNLQRVASSTAATLGAPTDKNKFGDIYTKPQAGQLAYINYQPPSQQVSASDVESRVSGSAGPRPGFGRLANVNELSYETAKNVSAMNPERPGSKVPFIKTTNQIRMHTNPRTGQMEDPTELLTKAREKLFQVQQDKTAPLVTTLSCAPLPSHDLDDAYAQSILDRKVKEITEKNENRTPDSYGSPVESPVPPRHNGKFLPDFKPLPRPSQPVLPPTRPNLINLAQLPAAGKTYSQASTGSFLTGAPLRLPMQQTGMPQNAQDSRNRLPAHRFTTSAVPNGAPASSRGPPVQTSFTPVVQPYQHTGMVTDDTGFASMPSRTSNRTSVSQRNASQAQLPAAAASHQLPQQQQQPRRSVQATAAHHVYPSPPGDLASSRHAHSDGGRLPGGVGSARHASGRDRAAVARQAGASTTDRVTVRFCYGRGSNNEYFMSTLHGQRTLANFKQSILSTSERQTNKYKFFFKVAMSETTFVHQELTDDNEVLPMFDGMVNAMLVES